jgi:hypothetical protein
MQPLSKPIAISSIGGASSSTKNDVICSNKQCPDQNSILSIKKKFRLTNVKDWAVVPLLQGIG